MHLADPITIRLICGRLLRRRALRIHIDRIQHPIHSQGAVDLNSLLERCMACRLGATAGITVPGELARL